MQRGLGFLLVFAGVWVVFLASTLLIFSTFLKIPMEWILGLSFGIPSAITGVIMLEAWARDLPIRFHGGKE